MANIVTIEKRRVHVNGAVSCFRAVAKLEVLPDGTPILEPMETSLYLQARCLLHWVSSLLLGDFARVLVNSPPHSFAAAPPAPHLHAVVNQMVGVYESLAYFFGSAGTQSRHGPSIQVVQCSVFALARRLR